MVELRVDGTDGMDEGVTVVVGGSVVYTGSSQVLQLCMDSADPVNKDIDYLGNLRFCHSGAKGEIKVVRVVIFDTHFVVTNEMICGIDLMTISR